MNTRVPDCRNLTFSPNLAAERMRKAVAVFGEGVTAKILAFALYLLGAKRSHIAEEMQLSENSIRNSVRKLFCNGLPALEDRRRSHSGFLPEPDKTAPPVVAECSQDDLIVRFGDLQLSLPLCNRIQCRTMVLSLVNAKLIPTKEAAQILDLSAAHTRNLASSLLENDVEVLLDKRQGQLQSFVLTPEVRSEIILQSAANAMTGYPTSGNAIAAALQKRCGIELSDRTVRDYLQKFGLNKMAVKLPKLVEAVKKGSTQK